jgi:hypothetical protein
MLKDSISPKLNESCKTPFFCVKNLILLSGLKDISNHFGGELIFKSDLGIFSLIISVSLLLESESDPSLIQASGF